MRAVFRFLLGERGPTDVVVARSEGSAHFRLPNQYASRKAGASLAVVLATVGSYGIFVFVNGTLRHPERQRNYWAMGLGVATSVAFMIYLFVRLRIAWHYELLLTAADLRVFYVASGKRWQTSHIDLATVHEFSVRREGEKSSLQAESIDGSSQLVLREGDGGMLARLAELLAQEQKLLDPHGGTSSASAIS